MLDIDVDTREEVSGIPRLLADRFGARVRVRPLPVGDYTTGELGIERKTSLDLVRSIADGRAFDQARRLSRAFPRAALIIEGLFPPAACDGREDSYFAALAQLSWSFGLHIFPTRFPLDTALLITRFVQCEFDHATLSTTTTDQRRFSKPHHSTDRRLFLLQGFFGVGPGRARNLLRAFGTLRSVFCAPMDAWREVSGIGPRLARQMNDLLDESSIEDGERSAG